MLMIHAGPLFSALQALGAHAPANVQTQHIHQSRNHDVHGQSAASSAHAHHSRSGASAEPAWVAALDLCGYCELLTLNPPLTLSPDLALPWYAPAFSELLPELPLPPAIRRSSGHPRAPPSFHA